MATKGKDNAGASLLKLFPQTTNFRLFQVEKVCRRHFYVMRKWQKVHKKGRKHCGKRRNCSLRAISPFPTVFSKRLYYRHVKHKGLFGKELKIKMSITCFSSYQIGFRDSLMITCQRRTVQYL